MRPRCMSEYGPKRPLDVIGFAQQRWSAADRAFRGEADRTPPPALVQQGDRRRAVFTVDIEPGDRIADLGREIKRDRGVRFVRGEVCDLAAKRTAVLGNRADNTLFRHTGDCPMHGRGELGVGFIR